MPKLPTHDSQRQFVTSQPQFLRTGQKESEIYDIAAKGLGRTMEIAGKWEEALSTIQTTTAKVNFSTGALDILNRAANDVDYNNSEQYYKELNTLKTESLKGFSNKAVENMVALDLDHNTEIARIKIGNIYKKKILEVGWVEALNLIDLEKSNYINSPDEQGKLVSAAKIKNIIDAHVKVGIFGLKEGKKLYEDSIKEAQVVIKDKEDLRKKQEKEILLANKVAQNEREDELVQMRVNMADAQGNVVTPVDLIEMTRTDMNNKNISARFAQVYINNLKSIKLAEPTQLENIIKYNELVDRNAALAKQESGWFGMGKVPFEDIAKFRADTIEANADGYITNKQMIDLLSETSKTFYRNPVFQNALDQLAAHSSLYATQEAQSRAKAEMYGNLIEKVISGKKPYEAVTEVITEKISSEIGEVAEKDEYGFTIGEIRKGYTYVGNNKWQKK